MSATFSVAQDEILGLFKAAWDTTTFDAVYENVSDELPTTADPWARVRLRHFPGGPASLAGALGTQSFERSGLFTAQIFVPVGEGLSRAYDLVKIVADAFEGKSTASGVWFRSVRINEVGPDGAWYQVNMVAEFAYDEVK